MPLIERAATESDWEQWDDYVSRHPSSTHYHQGAWGRVIQEAFGHEIHSLMAREADGRMSGVLPLVFMSSRLFGRFLVSMPFLNYGGVLADHPLSERALLEAAVALARERGAHFVELRETRRLDIDWPSRQHKVSMRLQLPSQFDAFSIGVPSTAGSGDSALMSGICGWVGVPRASNPRVVDGIAETVWAI